MNPYARAILDHTHDISFHEWARADTALLLLSTTTTAEFKRICADELNTSHRNVERWARKAEKFPEQDRDPLYAYRSHDRKMLDVVDSLRRP